MSQHLTLYGLKTCDTCRKALKSLAGAGVEVTFVDLRARPLDPARLVQLLDSVGDAAINRKSTTWRGLGEDERAQDPAQLLAAHPTLIKRPVIERSDRALSVGWTPQIAAEFGGT